VLLFLGGSKESQQDFEQSNLNDAVFENLENNNQAARFVNDQAITFLNEYYTEGYAYGALVEIDSNEGVYTIVEILVESNSSINGYITIDQESGDLNYFADVDRENETIYTHNFLTDEYFTFSDLETNENGESILDIDIIDFVSNYDPSSAEGKFWGTSCGDAWSFPNGQTYKTCCYSIFWINVKCKIVPA